MHHLLVFAGLAWNPGIRGILVVAIGVGGTLDVLAGTARRMPKWSSRLGVEWLLRVGLDPSRWRRIPNLLRFTWMVAAGRELPG